MIDDPPPPEDADDAAWLLARSEGKPATPPRPDAARQYAALEELIGDLDPIAPPADWQAAVLRRADAAPAPPRRRWLLTTIPALAAAALLVLWLAPWRGGPSGPPPLLSAASADRRVAFEVVRDHAARGHDIHVGDRLIARGRVGGVLRVYRDDRTLVAECPRDPACQQRPDGADRVHELTLTLDAPGSYRVVRFEGAAAPSSGSYDDDFRAADPKPIDLNAFPVR